MTRFMDESPIAEPTLELSGAPGGTLRVVVTGVWRQHFAVPASTPAVQAVVERAPSRIVFDTTGLSGWDGSLLALAQRVTETGTARGIPVDRVGLPAGALRLLERAEISATRPASSRPSRDGILARIGARTVAVGGALTEVLAFIGDLIRVGGRALRRRAHLRRQD